ncbi:MAG: DUF5678 domain-containing protein [Candidatus Binatia bacterium]
MNEQGQIIDLSELLRPYKGKWVAISGDKSQVLCAALTIEQVLRESEDYKDREPIILRVPDEHTAHLL